MRGAALFVLSFLFCCLPNPAAGQDVDWLDLVLKEGFQTSHQLGMRGGSEKTQFNVSLGYFNEDGIPHLKMKKKS